MKYLVTARVRPGKEADLLRAIERGTLGEGSVAGDEYLHDMGKARLMEEQGTVRWVECCFCWEPLAEERPYWEKYFELVRVQDAHSRRKCRDLNGSEPWACCDCDCTDKLEERMEEWGRPFLEVLRESAEKSRLARSMPPEDSHLNNAGTTPYRSSSFWAGFSLTVTLVLGASPCGASGQAAPSERETATASWTVLDAVTTIGLDASALSGLGLELAVLGPSSARNAPHPLSVAPVEAPSLPLDG